MTEYKVFYSWQSDLSRTTNEKLIQKALENAAKAIKIDKSLHVEPVIDRDTLGSKPSADIANEVFSKIDQSRAFVCDVSIINGIKQIPGKGKKRPTANPNVLVELGYAKKLLGMDKIIMVMNTAYGKPELLPADIRQLEAVTYRAPTDTKRHTTTLRNLESKLEKKLRLIFQRPDRLHVIPFNYQDSPMQHDWDIKPDPEASDPTFEPISDGYVGDAIRILPNGAYDMNYRLPVLEHVPKTLEFIADYGTTSVVYAGFKMAPMNHSNHEEGWMPILEGSGQSQPVKDANREWEIFRYPAERRGNWKVFRIDLNEVFNETFGTKGWVYEGLFGFRIRGRIAIASITVS